MNTPTIPCTQATRRHLGSPQSDRLQSHHGTRVNAARECVWPAATSELGWLRSEQVHECLDSGYQHVGEIDGDMDHHDRGSRVHGEPHRNGRTPVDRVLKPCVGFGVGSFQRANLCRVIEVVPGGLQIRGQVVEELRNVPLPKSHPDDAAGGLQHVRTVTVARVAGLGVIQEVSAR